MKYAAAYYLFLLYCTVLLRCAIPVACDALSHVFNEEKHLATVHAVYGNNHLEKEVAANETDNNKTATTVKYEEPVPVHLQTIVLSVAGLLPGNSKTTFSFIPFFFLNVHIPHPFPPPKLS